MGRGIGRRKQKRQFRYKHNGREDKRKRKTEEMKKEEGREKVG